MRVTRIVGFVLLAAIEAIAVVSMIGLGLLLVLVIELLTAIEAITVVTMIGLGVLLLVAIEFGLFLRGKPVRELLPELREGMRLIRATGRAQ